MWNSDCGMKTKPIESGKISIRIFRIPHSEIRIRLDRPRMRGIRIDAEILDGLGDEFALDLAAFGQGV